MVGMCLKTGAHHEAGWQGKTSPCLQLARAGWKDFAQNQLQNLDLLKIRCEHCSHARTLLRAWPQVCHRLTPRYLPSLVPGLSSCNGPGFPRR